jgi:non-ribosomal peptide synthetase component F
MPRLELGPGIPGAPVPVVERPLSRCLLSRIGRAAREHDGGYLAVLLCALSASLPAIMGEDDFGVGVPVTRRVDEQTSSLVGCLIDTVCVRLGPVSRTSPREAARAVREALAHSDLPFAEVVQACGAQGTHHASPLFQVLAAVQEAPDPLLCLPGLEVRARRFRTGAPPPAPLAVEVLLGDAPCLRVSADPARVRAGLAEEVAAALLAWLER